MATESNKNWGSPSVIYLIYFFSPFLCPPGALLTGLHPEELIRLKDRLTKLKVMFSTTDDFFEIDMAGVDVLNMLADENYRIIGQSMVIEKSTVGGGIVQVEKTSWTLEKQ